MSAQPNRKLSATLLLLLILAIPFMLMYYLSTDFYKRRAEQWQTSSTAVMGSTQKSRVNTDQVILKKDEMIDVGKTRLVYRGIENRMIQIDLYLLDLDPKESFRLKFSKKQAKKEISIGDDKYRLLSMNDRFLNLKIVSQFRTP